MKYLKNVVCVIIPSQIKLLTSGHCNEMNTVPEKYLKQEYGLE
jgi:hypothetical protein